MGLCFINLNEFFDFECVVLEVEIKQCFEVVKGDCVCFVELYLLEGVVCLLFVMVLLVIEKFMVVLVDDCSGVVIVDLEEFFVFEYGYVVIVYKFQGFLIKGKVFVYIDLFVNKYLFYVMFIWYVNELVFYVDDEDFLDLWKFFEFVMCCDI